MKYLALLLIVFVGCKSEDKPEEEWTPWGDMINYNDSVSAINKAKEALYGKKDTLLFYNPNTNKYIIGSHHLFTDSFDGSYDAIFGGWSRVYYDIIPDAPIYYVTKNKQHIDMSAATRFPDSTSAINALTELINKAEVNKRKEDSIKRINDSIAKIETEFIPVQIKEPPYEVVSNRWDASKIDTTYKIMTLKSLPTLIINNQP